MHRFGLLRSGWCIIWSNSVGFVAPRFPHDDLSVPTNEIFLWICRVLLSVVDWWKTHTHTRTHTPTHTHTHPPTHPHTHTHTHPPTHTHTHPHPPTPTHPHTHTHTHTHTHANAQIRIIKKSTPTEAQVLRMSQSGIDLSSGHKGSILAYHSLGSVVVMSLTVPL
jgi:hypothetical protein